MKLVIYPAVEQDRLDKILAVAGKMRIVNCEDEEHAIHEIVDADALFGKLTPPMLAAATKLRWVQTATASLEHYIFPELIEHPCVLTNMRGLYSDVIADHVLCYILCFARNMHLYFRQQLRRHWEAIGGEESRSNFLSGPGTVSGMDRAHMHMSDCTLGVIGLGNIGGEIARRGLAFGMRVVAVDPVQTEAPEGVESLLGMDRLNELLATSDFVVIAAPHTPETEKMFRRPQMQAMKETGILINIGRGAIVVLDDLVDALNAKEIGGAALDVAEIEPLPPAHPLWKLENVIITPHVAAATVHIARRHTETLLENIRRFVNDEPLMNIASKKDWF